MTKPIKKQRFPSLAVKRSFLKDGNFVFGGQSVNMLAPERLKSFTVAYAWFNLLSLFEPNLLYFIVKSKKHG